MRDHPTRPYYGPNVKQMTHPSATPGKGDTAHPVASSISNTTLISHEAAPAAADPRRPILALALDGGGIRGMVELIIIHKLLVTAGYDSNCCPGEVFDIIGGTSTGDLIALMLVHMKMSIPEAMAIFEKLSKKIFRLPLFELTLRYILTGFALNTSIIEDEIKKLVLKKLGSVDAPMTTGSDNQSKVLCISTPHDDCGTGRPILFRSYHLGNLRASKDPIWQIARATSAAPGYFAPQKIGTRTYIDGGVGTNNPAECVLEEVGQLWPDRPVVLISIGTGNIAARSANDPKRACISVATDTERVHERLSKEFKKGILPVGSSYHRFQVDDYLGSDVPMLAWDKLGLIKKRTEMYLNRPEIKGALEDAATALKSK